MLFYGPIRFPERTYAKNAAVDQTYQVKIDEGHHGERREDIRDGLHHMFDRVLQVAQGNLVGNDLGRVVIQHDGLHNPIIIPLQPLDRLNVNVVMGTIKKCSIATKVKKYVKIRN